MISDLSSADIAPRKGAKQARSAQTVRVILEAAARVLENHGLAGFKTHAVAAKAGVSVGSLYQYFPRKDALMAALIRDDVTRFQIEIESVVTRCADTDLASGLNALADAALDHQLARWRLALILDLEESRLPMDDEAQAANRNIRTSLQRFLGRSLTGWPGDLVAATAADMLTLAKALIDTASQTGSVDRDDLKQRVLAAVGGYLAHTAATKGYPCPDVSTPRPGHHAKAPRGSK